MSEGEVSDEERIGISSYLGDSIVDPNTILSIGRVVAPDLPSSIAFLSDFMIYEEDTRQEDESALIVSVVLVAS